MEAKREQIWPSGKLVTYRGNYPHYEVLDDGWRAATPTENREIQVDALAKMYQRNSIICCQSSLVDALIKADFDGFDGDSIENLYPDPSDWDEEQCREWLDDNGVGYDADADLEDLQDDIRDNAFPAEIMEWWLVDAWLAGKLKEIGQPVIDNDYGTWWGRCATGQSLIMDGTLQEVADSTL